MFIDKGAQINQASSKERNITGWATLRSYGALVVWIGPFCYKHPASTELNAATFGIWHHCDLSNALKELSPASSAQLRVQCGEGRQSPA